jgi:hypothetical protein
MNQAENASTFLVPWQMSNDGVPNDGGMIKKTTVIDC